MIGILNLIVLLDILGVFRQMKRGVYDEQKLEDALQSQGLMSRFFLKRVGDKIDTSWKMYPLGILFGLGFDTATEIGLLAIAAGVATHQVPFLAIISLPIIFAAAMSLMDTADGAFMSQAYGWAFSNPVRKVYYNITVTSLSVAVALIIGMIELLQVMAAKLSLEGGFWDYLDNLNFGNIGYVVVGLFVATWAFSVDPLEDPPHRGPLGRAAWSGAEMSSAVSERPEPVARRQTRQRSLIWDVLAQADGGHLSAADVEVAVRAAGSPLHRATIYRTLDRLVDDGLLIRTNLGADGQPVRDRARPPSPPRLRELRPGRAHLARHGAARDRAHRGRLRLRARRRPPEPAGPLRGLPARHSAVGVASLAPKRRAWKVAGARDGWRHSAMACSRSRSRCSYSTSGCRRPSSRTCGAASPRSGPPISRLRRASPRSVGSGSPTTPSCVASSLRTRA